VQGESQISNTHKEIKRIFLQPAHPPAYPEAIRAILDADLIILGPGSLYTSVLPNLLVEDLSRAIKASNAVKVYICNVATQQGETDEFDVADHIKALTNHVGNGIFDYVLANNNYNVQLRPEMQSSTVTLNSAFVQMNKYKVIVADVIDAGAPTRHDSKKLGQSIMRVYYDGVQATNDRSRRSDDSDSSDMTREPAETATI
jgi:uncharacterized cofD-like protein